MSDSFKLACIQVTASDDLAENLQNAVQLAHRAHSDGAEFLTFPECVSMMAFGRNAVHENSFEEDGHPALQRFVDLADELKSWVLVGSLPVNISPGRVANRGYLIDDKGVVRTSYDKIHMFDVELENGESYRESDTYNPGSSAVIADTPWGKLGMTICYDLRFPQIYRELAQHGAMMLSVPSAFTRPTGEAHWEVLLRARAIECGAYVFAPAQCGVHAGGRKTYGHSLIIDPWGRVLADGGEKSGYVLAEIHPAYVEEVRSSLPSLQHDRKYTKPTK